MSSSSWRDAQAITSSVRLDRVAVDPAAGQCALMQMIFTAVIVRLIRTCVQFTTVAARVCHVRYRPNVFVFNSLVAC
jgi:hypothetical protein